MNITCIALDLDGTTLTDDKGISPRTRSAIETAIAAGVHVVVASGRCLDALPDSVTEIPGIEYAITSNGAAIYELSSRRCIRRVELEEAVIEKILYLTHGRQITYEVFYRGVPYANRAYVEDPLAHGATPYAVNYIQSTRKPVEDIEAFIEQHKKDIDGMDLITRDQELRSKLWQQLEEQIPDLYITSSVPNRIELASIRAGKHHGLEFLLDRLHLMPEQAAAFGDADNDMELLSYVRYGMAVENATERCRQAAWKTVPSNQQDGVAVGIEQLLEMKATELKSLNKPKERITP